MALKLTHVEGTKHGKVILYALSTCGWCRKTKALLNELGVDYYYVDTDLLVGAERDEAMQTIMRWNPACSFPTLVLDDQRCIIGFDEAGIRKLASP